MRKNIESIEGVGPKTGETLRSAGIRTADDLLEAAATPASRAALARITGISEAELLKFVNMADLFRINGVATQYAELLECAGVDTVKPRDNVSVDEFQKRGRRGGNPGGAPAVKGGRQRLGGAGQEAAGENSSLTLSRGRSHRAAGPG